MKCGTCKYFGSTFSSVLLGNIHICTQKNQHGMLTKHIDKHCQHYFPKKESSTITLTFNEKASIDLVYLEKELDTDTATIFKKAIALLKLSVDSKLEGKKIEIMDKEGNFIEIIGI